MDLECVIACLKLWFVWDLTVVEGQKNTFGGKICINIHLLAIGVFPAAFDSDK
jgi:hypothetical protein